MEMRRALLSYRLLGTFLLLSNSLSLSDSSHEVAFQNHYSRRRLLTTTPNNIIQQYLIPHNKIRSNLGLPPLKWSDKLSRFANSWAQQRRGDCALIHSNANYGENLFWGSGNNWQPSDAVAAWAAEKNYYNYNTNRCSMNKDCLRYTQMVWRQSLKVGCAKVTSTSGDTFITCNYDPHGNVIGQKPF